MVLGQKNTDLNLSAVVWKLWAQLRTNCDTFCSHHIGDIKKVVSYSSDDNLACCFRFLGAVILAAPLLPLLLEKQHTRNAQDTSNDDSSEY